MKPRKSWEPEYRFGGAQDWYSKPPILGSRTTPGLIKTIKPKKTRKKK